MLSNRKPKQTFKQLTLVITIISGLTIMLVYLAYAIYFYVPFEEETYSEEQECGVVYDEYISTKYKRIVNGRNALKDAHPWLVSLRWILNLSNSSFSAHICGGSLVIKYILGLIYFLIIKEMEEFFILNIDSLRIYTYSSTLC